MLNIHINKKLKKKELQHLVGTLSDAKHFLRVNFFFFQKIKYHTWYFCNFLELFFFLIYLELLLQTLFNFYSISVIYCNHSNHDSFKGVIHSFKVDKTSSKHHTQMLGSSEGKHTNPACFIY